MGPGEGPSVRTRRQWGPLINSSQEHSVITFACWEDNCSDWQITRSVIWRRVEGACEIEDKTSRD